MQFATAIYGGFFGAGMGVMMLASLGLSQAGDYHRLNALKNMLAVVIAAVAIVVFVSGGVVAWPQAVVMIPGVALGGWSGVWVAKRVPQTVMRWIVIAVGLLGAAAFATVAPLQMWVLEKAKGAGQGLASSFNIAAFNLGNAIGAWLGGFVIDHGPGLGAVPLVAGMVPLAALGVVLTALRLERGRAIGAPAPAQC